MVFDVSHFHLHNMIDTCATWNLLAAQVFYSAASSVGCHFYCTQYVNYECLAKPRKAPLTNEEDELRNRLLKAYERGIFKVLNLEIDDLQDVEVLENRRRLGKGELSSIVLAKKLQQAFLTEDDNAVKLAVQVMNQQMVQTTAQLFGWLYFIDQLGDSDKITVFADYAIFGRYVQERFEAAYQEALRCRLMSYNPQTLPTS